MTTTTQISKSKLMKRAHAIYAYYQKNPRHAAMQNCLTWSDALKRAWYLEKEEIASKARIARQKDAGMYDVPVELISYSMGYGRGRGAYCGD
jgi:hypothetical protein